MWLPQSLYERLPIIWLVAGVAFLAAGFYMTLAYKWSIWYFGAGVSCLVWSGTLYMVRSRSHKEGAADDSHAEAAE